MIKPLTEIYDVRTKCTKCGDPRYEEGVKDWPTTKYYPKTDILGRICRNCGYKWIQLPLDREEGV